MGQWFVKQASFTDFESGAGYVRFDSGTSVFVGRRLASENAEGSSQVYVRVCTDDSEVDNENGEPIVEIELNDAVLYDYERGQQAPKLYLGDAIARIQRMRDAVPDPTESDSWPPVTPDDAYSDIVGAYDACLDVLQAITNGLVPAQGAPEVYRDATYSRSTQEHLRDLLRGLTAEEGWNEREGVHALAEVVARWDSNDATEVS